MFGLLKGIELYMFEIGDFATQIFYSKDGSLIIKAATVTTYNKLLRYINAVTINLDCEIKNCKKGKFWAITDTDMFDIKIVVTYI